MPILIPSWIAEIGKLVAIHKLGLIAIHLQELGGKEWKKDMHRVAQFREQLLSTDFLADFTRSVCYFDKDFNNKDTFTALGSIYLFHNSLPELKQFNLDTKSYDLVPVGAHEAYDNVHAIPHCHTIRYPREFFPECPAWTRKGHIYTRWTIGGKPLELINIHLFHDVDNRVVLEKSPSVYTYNRKKALEHSLKLFSEISPLECPSFIFGDFNFRQNQCLIKKHLEENGFKPGAESSGEAVHLQHPNGDSLRVMLKKFTLKCDSLTSNGLEGMRRFDTEYPPFKDILYEMPVKFPPSYPYSEEPELTDTYNDTRAPSWCDRVLMNKLAHDSVGKEGTDCLYQSAGKGVCLGDHKIIFLKFNLTEVLK